MVKQKHCVGDEVWALAFDELKYGPRPVAIKSKIKSISPIFVEQELKGWRYELDNGASYGYEGLFKTKEEAEKCSY